MDRPSAAWPAVSTIGDILKRFGLIEAKPRQRRPLACGETTSGVDTPNGEWAMDFKGWFRKRVDPLTVSGTASRYLVGIRITPPTHDGVKAALTRISSEVGLPDAIRSDNGSPFGSNGAGGLSPLSVWLLRLGIEPRFIPPASPQDNGRHERMHRTLKDATTKPPAETWMQQQVRFNLFRREYNEERPHEALQQTTPASHWSPPRRRLPSRIEEPWHDADTQVHRVRFMSRDLGLLDPTGRFHRFAPPRARLRSAPEPVRTDRE